MDTTLFTIRDFLSAAACRELVANAEKRGFVAAPITTSLGFEMMPEVRNNTRAMFDDEACARELWARLAGHVSSRDGWQPIGLNERLRFYRYRPQECFRWHRDGRFRRSAEEESRLTFMIYLNEDFEGGATEFEETRVVPRTGMALVFAHWLRHQGAPVASGTKYVLRSDVMFRNDGARVRLRL